MTSKQTDIVMSIRMCTTIVSLSLTVLAIWMMKSFKMTSGQYRLQLIVFACTVLECLVNLMSFLTYNHDGSFSGLCYAQGLLMQFAQVALFCWSAVFAFNIYMVIVRRRLDVDKYNTWYHGICWTVTGVCTIIPNFTFAYGKTTVWCWISKEASFGNVYRISTFFIPFYAAWIVILFVCFSIVYRLLNSNSHHGSDEHLRTSNLVRRFYAYPIVFLVCYIPATVNRINNWVTGNDIYALFIIHVLASPSLGTLNAIIFFSNMEVRKEIGSIVVRYCCFSFGGTPIPPKESLVDELPGRVIEHSEDDILDEVLV